MDIHHPDWKRLSFFELDRALEFESLDFDIDGLFEGAPTFVSKLISKTGATIYPTFDEAALENGFSNAQYGAFLGHFSFVIRRILDLDDWFDLQVEKMEKSYAKIEAVKEESLAKCDWKTRISLRRQIRAVDLLVWAVGEIRNSYPELVRRARQGAEVIKDLVGEAAVSESKEHADFLTAFQKAQRMETLSPEGRIITRRKRDQKAAEIRVLLILWSFRIHRYFKSVPSLHKCIARWSPGETFSQDPETLEWDKDFETVEYVCRDAGLKLAKVGRPRKA